MGRLTLQSPRFGRWWSWLLAACVSGLIAWFALDPTESLLMVPPFGTWNDEFLHVCAFALLAATVVAAGSSPWALTAVAAFAALIEGAQTFVPSREANMIDFSASMAGVALGWFAATTLRALVALIRRLGRA